MFPAGALAERIVMEDDVIPLSKPIQATDSSLLHSISVQKGQVCLVFCLADHLTDL